MTDIMRSLNALAFRSAGKARSAVWYKGWEGNYGKTLICSIALIYKPSIKGLMDERYDTDAALDVHPFTLCALLVH